MIFEPKRVLIEQDALQYPMGKNILEKLKDKKIELGILKSHNRVTEIPGKTPIQAYQESKNTLVAGVRRTLDFETCKPSAHFQLPLATGCAGMCSYCYLNTQLGKKPYIRVYVNIDEILEKAKQYIEQRKPDITVFEGAATSDPIPVERYTGALHKTIEFFGNEPLGRFRFVTKFTDVEGILDAKHNQHTMVRFSINADKIVRQYEHKVPGLEERVEAAYKVAQKGYPLGFIIAPVFLYDQWESDYGDMLNAMKARLKPVGEQKIHFEIISHRFTKRAKQNINTLFPNNDLPMEEETRKFKYGQFGYGKYIYNQEQLKAMEVFFRERIHDIFPNSQINYVI